MDATDLYLKHDKVFAFENNAVSISEIDYDKLKVDTYYYVITKTGRFSIYKKTENFDDEFIKLENDAEKAEEFLKGKV
ncbi:hypothetical protein BH23BAC1_BH23BAC1_04390 [soil metagenome]